MHVPRGSTVVRSYVVHAVGTLFFAHSTNWSMMVGQAAVVTWHCQLHVANARAHDIITLLVMFIKVPVK